MQWERDLLNERVLPAVNAVAKKHGDAVSFSDLRWGINTSGLDDETSGKKILNACLYEIDNCRPYMIVFLGERYGWCPGAALLRRAAEEHPPFYLEDYDISVTALEIEYGALADPERLAHTLFCFRAPSDDMPKEYLECGSAAQKRLAALKEKILSRPGAHVYTYEIPWGKDISAAYGALAEHITKELCALLSVQWQKNEGLSPLEKEKTFALSYALERAESFYSRPAKLDLYEYLLEHVPFFLSSGGAGDGKTSFFCKLISERYRKGVRVLPIFCGLQSSGADVFSIARHMIDFLSDACGENFASLLPAKEDAAAYQDLLADALAACGRLGEKLEIFIDALGVADACGIYELAEMPFYSDKIPENISIVIGAPFHDAFHVAWNYAAPWVSPISADAFDKERIAAHMMRAARKEIDADFFASIARKAKNPLHLKWILNRLAIMRRTDFERIAAAGGGMDAITSYQKDLIGACPDTLDEMGAFLARTACEYIGADAAKRMLDYIFASREGLSEESLKFLLTQGGFSWSGLDFRLLMQFLDDFLYLRADGTYVLLHPHIRKGFQISSDLYVDLLHEIASHGELSENDVFNYVYYAVCAKQADAFLQCIFENKDKWQTAAKALLYALRFGIKEKSYHDRDRFMEEWMSDCLSWVRDDATDSTLFLRFFENEYNDACAGDCYYFRVMAFVLYGDWGRVNVVNNRAARRKKEPRAPFTEEYERRFKKLCEDFQTKETRMAEKNPPRKERLIAPSERRGEILVSDRAFYLFFAERNAFFMRDDELLLVTSGYGIESYDLKYDDESGAIQLYQSSFDPHDGETLLETFTFTSPLAEIVSYTLEREDVRGARVLSIRPKS